MPSAIDVEPAIASKKLLASSLWDRLARGRETGNGFSGYCTGSGSGFGIPIARAMNWEHAIGNNRGASVISL